MELLDWEVTLEGGRLCKLCGEEEESAEHIWLDCPAIVETRKRYLGAYLLSPKDIREQEPSNLNGFFKTLGLGEHKIKEEGSDKFICILNVSWYSWTFVVWSENCGEISTQHI
ncbi:hypothetical protein J6590_025756 [Homalodisca vitripennis]|nr:hypothetical protein J6590_025756 [Homalodisca vitripennis]